MKKPKISPKEIGELRKNSKDCFFPVYFVLGPAPNEFHLGIMQVKNGLLKLNRTGVRCLIEMLKGALREMKK